MLVDINSVEVSYPLKGGSRKVIMDGVSLRIKEGEFVTVIGPSGCGKSTLLSLVLGSQFPNEGTVSIDGEQVQCVTPNVGIVYQRYSVIPNWTVLDNIAAGPIMSNTGIFTPIFKPRKFFRVIKEAREEAREYIKSVGLSADDALKYPYALSGGMRQRVAIAQSLIMKPKILLMDEPFSALDAATREEMQLFVLEQWAKHKMTVFFVTHEIEEAVYLGTRLIGLSQYWSDGNGAGKFARIVVDRALPGPHPKATSWKHTPEAQAIVQSVKRDTMDRNRLKKIEDFDLTHSDARKEL